MSIQNWPEQQRPREKLLSSGPQSLTDAELLALLLRTGCQGMNVIDLSDHLIQRFGGLSSLLNTKHDELIKVKGLGQAKITQLNAILELCRRVLSQKLSNSDILNSPDSTRQYLQLHFQGMEREQFACLFLDTRHRVIALETLVSGLYRFCCRLSTRSSKAGSPIQRFNHYSLSQPSIRGPNTQSGRYSHH